MKTLKIKIWDNNPDPDLKQMFTAVTSVYGKLRFILGMGQERGWNTLIEYKPSKGRFIPLLCTGMVDKNKELIWEGDFIKFKFDETDEFDLEGHVIYESENACFSVEFRNGKEIATMPLFAMTPLLIRTGGNIYEGKA